LFCLFLIPQIVGDSPNWTIDGNSVCVNNTKLYLNIAPHTRQGSGYIYLDLLSKQYDGDVTIIFGVNNSLVKPKSFEYYNPHNVTYNKSYTCEYDFNYTLSPNYAWCFIDCDDPIYEEELYCFDKEGDTTIFEHSFETGNIPAKTIYWSETVLEEYSVVPRDYSIINHEYDNKNKWYVVEDIPVTAGVEQKARVYIEMPYLTFGESSDKYDYKYDFGFMPSSYPSTKAGFQQAISDNNFLFLDPWTEGTDGLVSYWTFDDADTDGTTAIDVHDGNNGTILGGVTTSESGILNEAYSFDTLDESVDADYVPLRYVATFTISFWMNTSVDNTWGYSVDRWEYSSGNYRSWAFLSYSDDLRFWTSPTGSHDTSAEILYDWTGKSGSWHMVTGTYNGTHVELYIDGSSFQARPLASVYYGISPLVIGSDPVRAGMPFNGSVDEIGFWNRTLSASEVSDLYNEGAGLAYPFTPPDSTPPIVSMMNSSFSTYDDTPSIWFNATDETAATLDCHLYFDGTDYDYNATVANNTETILTSNTTLPFGNYTVNITCSDSINTGFNDTNWVFILADTTPPTISIPTINYTTNDDTPSITFTATDDIAATLECYLYFNGTDYDYNAAVVNNTPTTLTVNTTLPDGNYSVNITCSDGVNVGFDDSSWIYIFTRGSGVAFLYPYIELYPIVLLGLGIEANYCSDCDDRFLLKGANLTLLGDIDMAGHSIYNAEWVNATYMNATIMDGNLDMNNFNISNVQNLDVDDDLDVDGNTNLNDLIMDVSARIRGFGSSGVTFSDDIYPYSTGNYDIGNSTLLWRGVYGEYFYGNNLNVSGSIIVTNLTVSQYFHSINTSIFDNGVSILGSLIVNGTTTAKEVFMVGDFNESFEIVIFNENAGSGAEATLVIANDKEAEFKFSLASAINNNLSTITIPNNLIINASGNVGINTTTPSSTLHVDGDVNITGKIHNRLAHVFGLATKTHTVAAGGVWYNITMNRTHADTQHFTLSADNITIIVPHDGHYTLTFGMGIMDSGASAASPHSVGMRIEINGAELSGSYIEDDLIKKDADEWMEHTTHAVLSEGDEIRLQYIGEVDTITIEQEDTWAAQGFSAFGYIQEVIH